MTLTRRAFLGLAAAGLSAAMRAGAAETSDPPTFGLPTLIDVNVNLSRWPLRRLPYDDTAGLASMLRRHGVAQAWIGSFDGLLHKDIASVNTRLTEECRRHRGLLQPFGSINLQLPDWPEDLRRCADEHRMPGIRLHPNYHGYSLDHPDFARLLHLAAARKLIVQLVLVMEDERMMHPRLRVDPVDTRPLAGLVRQTPGLRLVILNGLRTLRGAALRELVASGLVYVELSMLEGVGGASELLTQLPVDRLLFGSHAPLFYFESALLKLKESPLTSDPLQSISHGNARALLRLINATVPKP